MCQIMSIKPSDYLPSEYTSKDANGEEDRKEPAGQNDTDGEDSTPEEPTPEESTREDANRKELGRAEPSGSTTGNPKPEETDANQCETAQSETDSKINRLLTEEVLQVASGLQSQDSSGARTTFCLSLESRTLFEDLSSRSDRSQKDLLETVLRLCRTAWKDRPERLRETAPCFQAGREVESEERRTMAIVPDVRDGLNNLSDETGLPRDQLVEVGIRLAWAATEEEAKRRVRPHEEILDDLRALGEEVEEVKTALAGHEKRGGLTFSSWEDPLESGLSRMLEMIDEMTAAVESEIESGEPMGESREFW